MEPEEIKAEPMARICKADGRDRKGNLIDRVAPIGNQPKSCSKSDGTIKYWCGKCDHWGNHDKDHHDQFKARFSRNRNCNNDNNDSSNANSGTTSTNRPALMHHQATAAHLLTGQWNTSYDSNESF